MTTAAPSPNLAAAAAARATDRPCAAARRLAAAQLLSSIGDGAFYVTSAIFFTRAVGLSALQLGGGLSVAWGIGAVTSLPVGYLADRCGPRRAGVLLAMATAATVAVLPLAGSFPAFLLIAAGYATAQSGLGAVRQALLATRVARAQRVAARAWVQRAGNGGMTLGAALGGAALLADRPATFMAVFALDAVGFLTAGLLLHRLPQDPSPSTTRISGGATRRLIALRDRPFLAAAGLNAVLFLYMPMLSVALPLWISQRTAAPSAMTAVVLAVNTLAVLLAQTRAAAAVTDAASAGRALRAAGAGLATGCLLFAFASYARAPVTAVLLLLAGAAIQVIAEMLLAAASWYLAFTLAPDHAHGEYQAVWSAGIPVARCIGPLLLAAGIVRGGVVGWSVLGSVFLLAGAAAAAKAGRLAGRRTDQPASTTAPAGPAAVELTAKRWS